MTKRYESITGTERDMRSVIGWDVGGAHLKAARAENGRIVDAIQLASPLRLGLDRLAQAFAEAKARMGVAQLHAVTMTGELADTFSSRAEAGKLSALAVRELAPAEVALYAGRAGFIAPRDAPRHVEDIASANWFASAALAAACSARRCSWTSARPPPTWCRSSTAPSPRAATPMRSASPPESWSIPAWCAAS